MQEIQRGELAELVFATVVYPGAEPWMEGLFEHLLGQDFQNFDVLIINDGMQELEKWTSRYAGKLKIIVVPFTGTIPRVREQMLREICIRGYRFAVFGDCDDGFSQNRIRVSMEKLGETDVVVNDLSSWDGNSFLQRNYLSGRMNAGFSITEQFLADKNVGGFSNVAVRCEWLDGICFADNLIAVDWAMMVMLLKKGAKVVFFPGAETFYRQHAGNTIGIGQFTPDKVITGLRTKAAHYELLSVKDPAYSARCLNFRTLLEVVVNNNEKLQQYMNIIRSQKPENALWWEEITYQEL